VINLGVSATAPDEYYYRLENIALPLAPKQVFVFITVASACGIS